MNKPVNWRALLLFVVMVVLIVHWLTQEVACSRYYDTPASDIPGWCLRYMR